MRPPNQARPSYTGEASATGSRNSRRNTPKSLRIALLPDTERGQLDQVDRDIAGFGAAHDDRPGYRSQGMATAVAGRGEWCRYRADIMLDIVEGAAYLHRELPAGIDGHRRRSVGIDREEVFGPVRPRAALSLLQTKWDSSTRALNGAISDPRAFGERRLVRVAGIPPLPSKVPATRWRGSPLSPIEPAGTLSPTPKPRACSGYGPMCRRGRLARSEAAGSNRLC
jgi:hypothetical protein